MPIPLGILAVAGAGAGSANAFDLLETTTLGSNTSSVSFTNLNSYSDYKHLQLRIVSGDSLDATGGTWSKIRFNGATTNYAWHLLRGDGSNAAVNTGSSTSEMYVWQAPYGGGQNDGFSGTVLEILDFNSTVKTKTIRAISGYRQTNGSEVSLGSGFWNSTNAITSIEISTGNANLVANSRFSLYGIRG